MVEYPTNEFTEMIARTSEVNRSGHRGAGVASATPLPTVRSADLGMEVADAPLTDEQRAELDLLALQAGIQDERLAGSISATAQGPYATLDEAIRAGAPPVNRTFLPVAMPPANPFGRLPNFVNVTNVDLLHGMIIIDGMEFPISEDEVVEIKAWAVATARRMIMDKLSEAESLFTTPKPAEVKNEGSESSEASEVQPKPEGSS